MSGKGNLCRKAGERPSDSGKEYGEGGLKKELLFMWGLVAARTRDSQSWKDCAKSRSASSITCVLEGKIKDAASHQNKDSQEI